MRRIFEREDRGREYEKYGTLNLRIWLVAKIQDLRQKMDWINRLWGRLSDESATTTTATETGFEIESIEPMLLLSGSMGDAGDFIGDDATFVTDFCDLADFSMDSLVDAGQGDDLLSGFGDGPNSEMEY